MNASCRSIPAFCYSELSSHLSDSSDCSEASWAESGLEERTTPQALKGGSFHVYCSNLRPFWPLFDRFQRLFTTLLKVHPAQNKRIGLDFLTERAPPPPPLFTVKLWNSDGIALRSCNCPVRLDAANAAQAVTS